EHAVTAEAELREAVARQRRDDRARQRGDGGDQRAVEQEAAEGLTLEDLAIVLEVAPAVGQYLQRQSLDLRHRLQRRHGHPEEREDDAQRARRHQRRRQRGEPRRLQYSTCRRNRRHCSSVTRSSVTKTNTAMTEASPS